MSGKNRIGWLVGVLAAAAFAGPVHAATIYLEDFTGQVGKGAIGPGGANPTVDLEGVDWTLDLAVDMTASSDFIQVRLVGSNEMLVVQDPGGPASWVSPVINISGLSDVEISIYIDAASANYNEDEHEVQFQYILDGGAPVTFFNADDLWGPVAADNDGFPKGTFSSDILPAGNSLQVVIFTDTRSGVHAFRFDDIQVTGVPEPASAALLMMGVAPMMLRRRRQA